jgi:hypothetical protein
MSTPTIPAGAAETSQPTPGTSPSNSSPVIPPDLLEKVQPLEREWATYLREVPRLLMEGNAGRHALIKGDCILSTWDTYRDALQAACERFGNEPFCIKQIDPRDPQRWSALLARPEA